MIIRKKLINKYYSEKLYSTGNEDLDNLLEKAFCDGYEYAQREYTSVKDTKKGFRKLVEGVISNDTKKSASGAKLLKLDKYNINAGKKSLLEELTKKADQLQKK